MNLLPDDVRLAWVRRSGAIVFSTTGADGMPNSIYATCTGLYADGKIVIADNYFSKTLENLKNRPYGSVLFITDENKAYQIKGAIEYYTEGEFFEFMKSWNPESHPGHGAAVLIPQEIYCGAKRLA
ncbi:MAG: pyridoxamine 5'-phosphate oxidase family protein [Victivallaceae bacterium]|nr:pyridoxamine 5'-phosphate oxidase family protein [Victivallaceae bacterium]